MKYFGTDGFRGEANINLTVEHAFKIGRFLGAYFKNLQNEWKEKEEDKAKWPDWVCSDRPRIVIGKDTRRSSYMYENALSAGLTASGADVDLMHVTTTPSVSYAVRMDDFCCGIMISASHNPYYDNGIKLLDDKGGKMDDELLKKIEDYIDEKTPALPLAEGDQIGAVYDYVHGRNRYIGFLMQTVRRSFKRLRIGLDCANGASFTIAKNVFEALGAETYIINDKPDGLNINLNAGSTHIDGLVNLVKDKKLDCGFAFDGDADRCIAVDNKGQVVNGDAIIYICGHDLKERNALPGNKVVTTIMSNFGLYKALDKLGIGYEKTDVGDKYVAADMFENGYALGGEQSGHIIFSKYAVTGDGILTALRVTEVMVENKTDLASLHADFKTYPQVLVNLKIEDKKSTLADESIKEAIRKADELLGDDGRSLVRASGTEPLIRVMAEHSDEKTCHDAVDIIVQAIKKSPYYN